MSPRTEVLATHTPELFAAAVRRASALLRAGQLVAVPTETVYGLAANALDADAVRRIFAAKGRPAHNPIIVHVADLTLARRCVAEWPENAERLAASFWPGPLTLVLRKSPLIPPIVTADGPTVGVRWPSHPFIQAVIRECGFPLAAPSANVSNQLSPTNAAHVRQSLGNKVPLIIDGGQAQVGIESTVVDLTSTPLQILRPGMIHEESLAAALGGEPGAGPQIPLGGVAASAGGPLRSPGQLLRHYAPRSRLVVLAWRDEADLRAQIASLGARPPDCQVVAHSAIPGATGLGGVSVIPHDPEAFARALYAELHRCDELGAGMIVIESVPATPAWRGIRDRLRRAAASEPESIAR